MLDTTCISNDIAQLPSIQGFQSPMSLRLPCQCFDSAKPRQLACVSSLLLVLPRLPNDQRGCVQHESCILLKHNSLCPFFLLSATQGRSQTLDIYLLDIRTLQQHTCQDKTSLLLDKEEDHGALCRSLAATMINAHDRHLGLFKATNNTCV